jgi:GNAT superfamily N-acetyltransferase
MMEIRRISAETTVDLRWSILRAGYPRETAIFAGDDLPTTIHLGGYEDDRLVAVASLYAAESVDEPAAARPMQLRGMATAPKVRGLGAGRTLLAATEAAAVAAGADWLWCNARVSALGFYLKHGWQVRSAEFDIVTVGPHVRMTKRLR